MHRRMSKIVVGVDGSEASKDALRWAMAEASLRNASVVAVHAWQPPTPPPEISPAFTPVPAALDLTDWLPKLQASARLLVEQVVNEVAGDESGVEIRPTAIEAPPATALIEAARDAELLVVGSRGHGGFTGLLLGSVSLQVVQHAPCPVVICRHGDERSQ
jgi:nucleotide-binding universal stress UspA family protein